MMAELTQEQLERAEVVYGMAKYTETGTVADGLRAAAPFLQFPQTNASEQELRQFGEDYQDDPAFLAAAGGWRFRSAIDRLLNRRNATLLPRSVDPRLAIIRRQLGGASMVHDLDGVAVKILHALDQAKSYSDNHVG